MNGQDVRLAAELLYTARFTKTPIQGLPQALRPHTIVDAYRIQACMVEIMGDMPVGWKVGATSKSAQNMFNINEPFCGLILGSGLHFSGENLSRLALRAPQVEAEYLFRLDRITRREAADEVNIKSAIKACHLGIEVCETAYLDVFGQDILSIIADNGVASRIVLGPEFEMSSLDDLVNIEVVMNINGMERGRGNGSLVLGNPINSLRWLVKYILERQPLIEENTIVATGTCTGMAQAGPGDRIEAHFEGLGALSLIV